MWVHGEHISASLAGSDFTCPLFLIIFRLGLKLHFPGVSRTKEPMLAEDWEMLVRGMSPGHGLIPCECVSTHSLPSINY